ncbi:hypothetical protein HUN01_12980 [Nostoc edaphicum CCNP1411]|uniref:Uncharacterized protein n=1 Tax=Nostoc edaphicum CCNP1411 TaxID=1472755 RepID=A0A7D7QM81_9NOSO|nr:hypothetical protein [Nostoc edaphicum]QMS88465.1 hypothetical protein HUN01_12980 [Nostoc edaphicum CCNP1411]
MPHCESDVFNGLRLRTLVVAGSIPEVNTRLQMHGAKWRSHFLPVFSRKGALGKGRRR